MKNLKCSTQSHFDQQNIKATQSRESEQLESQNFYKPRMMITLVEEAEVTAEGVLLVEGGVAAEAQVLVQEVEMEATHMLNQLKPVSRNFRKGH